MFHHCECDGVQQTLNDDDGVDEYVVKNVLGDNFRKDLKRCWKKRCSLYCEIYNNTCVKTNTGGKTKCVKD